MYQQQLSQAEFCIIFQFDEYKTSWNNRCFIALVEHPHVLTPNYYVSSPSTMLPIVSIESSQTDSSDSGSICCGVAELLFVSLLVPPSISCAADWGN